MESSPPHRSGHRPRCHRPPCLRRRPWPRASSVELACHPWRLPSARSAPTLTPSPPLAPTSIVPSAPLPPSSMSSTPSMASSALPLHPHPPQGGPPLPLRQLRPHPSSTASSTTSRTIAPSPSVVLPSTSETSTPVGSPGSKLPLSLRLIGLRMSQFHDDRHGRLDPMQKTLTNFIVSDVSSSVASVSEPIGLEVSDKHLLSDGEMTLSVDDQSYLSNDGSNSSLLCEFGDLLESNQFPLVAKCSFSNHAEGIKNMNDPCPPKFKSSSLEGINVGTKFSDGKAIFLGEQKVKLSWVDGCICSVCGIELPQSFIDEKQEHLDYHLAEMLQKEESILGSRHLDYKRFVRKPSQSREGGLKKQKSSPKEENHIPIDAFFTKSKNL